ncbi:hypothetical protein SFRURICE_001075 [Spodoptera frugiperda]|nr:hypothetical protein SFRURICE_001075 [Spodoptera frugiperda]
MKLVSGYRVYNVFIYDSFVDLAIASRIGKLVVNSKDVFFGCSFDIYSLKSLTANRKLLQANPPLTSVNSDPAAFKGLYFCEELHQAGAFPPEMCYATLLWMRLASTNLIHWYTCLALVETDSVKLCFLYACYGCAFWMASLLSIHRILELRIFLAHSCTLRRCIFIAHLTRTAT